MHWTELPSHGISTRPDLVVLSDDYFDPQKVPDDKIRQLKSVLTIVDGKVVYDALR